MTRMNTHVADRIASKVADLSRYELQAALLLSVSLLDDEACEELGVCADDGPALTALASIAEKVDVAGPQPGEDLDDEPDTEDGTEDDTDATPQ
jgi:hypothetical protein